MSCLYAGAEQQEEHRGQWHRSPSRLCLLHLLAAGCLCEVQERWEREKTAHVLEHGTQKPISQNNVLITKQYQCR